MAPPDTSSILVRLILLWLALLILGTATALQAGMLWWTLVVVFGAGAALGAGRVFLQGRRGLAFEWLVLASPFLLLRSKWALIAGVGVLVLLATEALTSEALDGSSPPPFRMRMVAGGVAATVGWLFLKSSGALFHRAHWIRHSAAGMDGMTRSQVLLLLGLAAFLVVLYQLVRGVLEWRWNPQGGEPVSLGLLAASLLLIVCP